MTDTLNSGGNSESVSTGPTTFAEAFAADATPASDAGASTPNAQPAVTAASTDPTSSQTAGEDDRSPFIPRPRFDEVNTKYQDAKTQLEKLAWASQIDPQNFNQMASWFLRAQTDTPGFTTTLLKEVLAHPSHGPAMRSEIARMLGSFRQPAPVLETEPTMPDPDVAITDANGQVVGRTYSAEGLAKRDAFLRSQTLQEVDAKYAPHLNTLQQIEQERTRLAEQRQAETFGSSFSQELATLPLFNEYKAEIGKALANVRLASDHPDAVRAAAYRVYHQIVGPKLQNGSQQAVLADLQRKAAASSAVNPASATASAPKGVSSFFDKSLQWG